MEITDFNAFHVPFASALALANYNEERKFVPALLPVDAIPDFELLTESNFGVAAVDGSELVGFLCFYPPQDEVFTSHAKGTFSPVHGHGAVAENREYIYKRMYQAAAEKLVKADVSSHAIALYAHDKPATNAFFTYGFGLRCIDAIRTTELITPASHSRYDFRKLDKSEVEKVRPLRHGLVTHLSRSPCFMYQPPEMAEKWLARTEHRDSRLFAAFDGDSAIAFIEVSDDGENFATKASDMQSVCGAFCLPAYRGKGIMPELLNVIITSLRSEGFTRLGVDFESFNPTANRFWQKYFDAYTHSVVRRIDDNIFKATPHNSRQKP